MNSCISVTIMNKILHLFDEQYVKKLFTDKVLPLYPDFQAVKKIKIAAPKKYIWKNSYHVVIEFQTVFFRKDGREVKLPIYCTAHSEEPRKNVYDGLKFLWEHSFSHGWLSIPHPLFYSRYFRGTFYRGVVGRNLYQYIRKKNFSLIEEIIPKTAAWFAKLHNLPAAKARNFNPKNSRIETVLPGLKNIFNHLKKRYPYYLEPFHRLYRIINEKEKKFLATTKKRWLVHGDAHPENVIRMSPRKIAVIDFTDLCLSDFARDLGTFLQQLEFMCNRKIGNPRYATKLKEMFLKSYFKYAKIKLDNNLAERIDNYYWWTAMRTATYFLLKDKPEPDRAKPLVEQAKKKLL